MVLHTLLLADTHTSMCAHGQRGKSHHLPSVLCAKPSRWTSHRQTDHILASPREGKEIYSSHHSKFLPVLKGAPGTGGAVEYGRERGTEGPHTALPPCCCCAPWAHLTYCPRVSPCGKREKRSFLTPGLADSWSTCGLPPLRGVA